jgi:hypothetical protein
VDAGIKDKFIRAVKKQTVLYRKLSVVIRSEQQALAGKDTAEMDEIVKKEETAIRELKKLEEEKRALFDKMAAEAGLPAGKGTKMKAVLLKAGQKEAAEIEAALIGLIQAVKDVDAVNAGNAHLLRNLVQYAGFAKAAREKIEKPVHTTYTRAGAKKTEIVNKDHRIDNTI